MKRLKKISKRTLSVLMCALMLMTAWVFVAMSTFAIGYVNGAHSQVHTVSNYQSAYASYNYLSGCAVPLDGSNGSPDMCVPGLSAEDDYVPQGMTYCEAKDWVLISAYPRTGSTSSVIYALDFSTGDLIAQFNLFKNDGVPLTAHIGGIACSDNNLYIADQGSTISYIPVSEFDVSTGTVNDVVVSGTASLSSALNGANTSYVSYADGVLWTGNFYLSSNNSYNKKANGDFATLMLGFSLSESSSAAEWDAFCSIASSPDYLIPLDSYGIDRVQCATVADGMVFIGTSYGRKNNSRLYAALLSKDASVPMTVNGNSFFGYTLSEIKNYDYLPMAEGMFVKDGFLYNVFESAAYQYHGAEISVSSDPSDVVWRFDTQKLINGDGEGQGNDSTNPFASFFRRFLSKLLDFFRYIKHLFIH